MGSVFQNSSENATLNNPSVHFCQSAIFFRAGVSVVDLITVLVGFSVTARLTFITVRAKNTIDILNFNLSIFHKVQYIMSFIDFLGIQFFPKQLHTYREFLFGYALIGGPLNLFFISMERYVAVVYPTSYPLLKKYRYRETASVAVWLIAVPSALLSTLLKVNHHTPVFLSVILTLMLWFNVALVQTLRKSAPGTGEIHPKKQRAIYTVRVISLMVMLCCCPAAALTQVHIHKITESCFVIPLCVVLLSVASVVHPLFYLSTQGKLCPCCTKQGK